MVAAARERGRDVVQADLNDYAPPAPVQVTMIFRAIYYARDRRALLAHIAGYTEKKLVFDLNPRQYDLAEVRQTFARPASTGSTRARSSSRRRVRCRPLPVLLLRGLERMRPARAALLRRRFSYLCCLRPGTLREEAVARPAPRACAGRRCAGRCRAGRTSGRRRRAQRTASPVSGATARAFPALAHGRRAPRGEASPGHRLVVNGC